MAKNSSNSYGISMVLGGPSPPKTEFPGVFTNSSIKSHNLMF
jgi:hypothetical protein